MSTDTLVTIMFLIMAVVIVSAIWTVRNIIRDSKRAKREKEQAILDRPQHEVEFFEGCLQAGFFSVDDLDHFSNTSTVLKIAKSCKLIPENEFSYSGQTKIMLRDIFYAKSGSPEGRKKINDTQRELEKAEWQQQKAYADLTGDRKPLTMLSEWLQSLQAKSAEPQSYMPTKKKSDGMIQAGTAAGIGGVIPAAASLASTAKRNAQIEAYNQAASGFNAVMGAAAVITESTGRKVAETIKRLSGKKIAKMTREQVFQKLKFDRTTVRLNQTGLRQTGTLVVETQLSLPAPITVNNANYFADGSVTAEIYKGEQKIGEAALVFPILGTDAMARHNLWRFYADSYAPPSSITLEGLCLFCKEAKKASPEEVRDYTVKIVPGKHLWAMESLSEFEVSQIKSL